MNLVQSFVAILLIATSFTLVIDMVGMSIQKLICLRKCDREFDYMVISPKKVFYDGKNIELSSHFLEMNNTFPSHGTISGSTSWNNEKLDFIFGGAVNSNVSVTEANFENAVIDWGYFVNGLE